MPNNCQAKKSTRVIELAGTSVDVPALEPFQEKLAEHACLSVKAAADQKTLMDCFEKWRLSLRNHKWRELARFIHVCDQQDCHAHFLQ